MTITNHDPDVAHKPTGLFHSDRVTELTQGECRELGIRPIAVDDRGLPKPPRTPVYRTGRLWTRDDMGGLFRRPWGGGDNIGTGDADSYIRTHDLRPVDHEPFPPMPELPNDEHPSSDDMAKRLFNDHVNKRAMTRKSRELFSVDGYPVFIPDAAKPSPNDTHDQRIRKNNKIESLSYA